LFRLDGEIALPSFVRNQGAAKHETRSSSWFALYLAIGCNLGAAGAVPNLQNGSVLSLTARIL